MQSGAIGEVREMIFNRDGARCVRSALDIRALNDIDAALDTVPASVGHSRRPIDRNVCA
jgi:hypothetical protein